MFPSVYCLLLLVPVAIYCYYLFWLLTTAIYFYWLSSLSIVAIYDYSLLLSRTICYRLSLSAPISYHLSQFNPICCCLPLSATIGFYLLLSTVICHMLSIIIVCIICYTCYRLLLSSALQLSICCYIFIAVIVYGIQTSFTLCQLLKVATPCNDLSLSITICCYLLLPPYHLFLSLTARYSSSSTSISNIIGIVLVLV